MPQTFKSFDALANHFATVNTKLPTEIHAGLDEAGARIQNTARNKLGAYQGAAGPFEAWRELAASTRRERGKAGYPEDEPEYVTGALERSILFKRVGNEAHVGSDDPIADYQERGTNRIPPRSFLGSTLFEMTPTLCKQMLQRIERLFRNTR